MIDQTSQFSAILTDLGVAKQAAADALGRKWHITEMAVGDANGTDPLPCAKQTQLINERRRAPLNHLYVDPENAALIVAEQVLPENVGGWWVREIGLYDADGDLIAIANCAPSFKPLLTQGTGRTQVVRMIIAVSNSTNIEITFDPGVVLATHTYVDSKVREELNKLDAKQSVRVATTENIVLQGLQTIDAVVLASGDRVLVKHQVRAEDNGLYVAGTDAWQRSEDARTNLQVTAAMTVVVEEGSTQADTLWLLVSNAPIDLGKTALAFQNITYGLAPLVSPAFIDTPTAPTAAAGSNTQQLANTAFVQAAITALIGAAPDGLNTLGALALALANDPDFATTMAKALAGKEPSLGFTPVQQGTGTGQLPNVMKIGYDGAGKVKVQVDSSDFGTLAFEASPAFSGLPTAPTAAAGNNSELLANTAFVQAAITALIGAAPGNLSTLGALARALGNDPDFVTSMNNALAGKQPNLGFTPVQQGTGWGQRANVMKIGYDGAGKVNVQVDSSDFGNVAFEGWVGTHFAHLASFQRYMGENGYQQLAGGTILQWGYSMTNANGYATFSFPIAFPNAVVGFIACARWFSPSAPIYLGTSSRNAAQATVLMNFNNAPAGAGFDWYAIGY